MLLKIGRHNDSAVFLKLSAAFIVGVLVGLVFFRDLSLDFTWNNFANGRIAWTSLLTTLFGCVIMLGTRLCGQLGKVFQFLLFGLQGIVFSFCTILFLNTGLDTGVFLALYIVAAPAFFHVFIGFLCTGCQLNRTSALAILVGVITLHAVRNFGFELVGRIFLSLV